MFISGAMMLEFYTVILFNFPILHFSIRSCSSLADILSVKPYVTSRLLKPEVLIETAAKFTCTFVLKVPAALELDVILKCSILPKVQSIEHLLVFSLFLSHAPFWISIEK